MKNTIGNQITLTLFGESHGEAVGCVLDGIPAGTEIDEALIRSFLERRKAAAQISTARREPDLFRLVSGVRNSRAEGTPVTVLIENKDARRSDYDKLWNVPRPSHADYPARLRYEGFEDLSGGGHFSGRLTAPLCAAGAICISMLEKKGIRIASHILSVHGIKDEVFDPLDPAEQIAALKGKSFPVLDPSAEERMIEAVAAAREQKDSLGGILETAVCGMPGGVGEPFFDSMESMLSHAMFSIPAVKGIAFGAGFDFAAMRGSEANDPYVIHDGKIFTETNHNGGISGGITNGMPLIFTLAVRPTSSIGLPQKSVDLTAMQETEIVVGGRHDPCILHRAVPCAEAMTALVLADLLIQRYGPAWFREV